MGSGTLRSLAALFTLASALYGLEMVSRTAGLLNHIEGDALLNGYQVMVRPGEFPQMREGDEFRAEKGHQEVLLGPGVFLRLGSHSAFRMVAAKPANTEIDFEDGSAILECAGLPKHGRLAITFRKAAVLILRNGVYRLDGRQAQLKVYDGEARVLQGGRAQKVAKGHQLGLGASLPGPEKFDGQSEDSLYLWSKMRSQHLAAANILAVRYIRRVGVSYRSNSWIWNPSYRTYTFLPLSRTPKNIWGSEFHGLSDAVDRGSEADSLDAERQWAEAVTGARRQAEWDCMTLEVRASQMEGGR